MLLATYHKQTHNIDPNISRQMLHRRRFATWDNVFCNIAKVFRNIPCASHPDQRLTGPFIRIVWHNTRPTLAPGSNVRALAVPLILTLTMLLCLAMYTSRKTCFPFVLGHTMHPMRLRYRPMTMYHHLCLAMSPTPGYHTAPPSRGRSSVVASHCLHTVDKRSTWGRRRRLATCARRLEPRRRDIAQCARCISFA
jgi:hypothetical protein